MFFQYTIECITKNPGVSWNAKRLLEIILDAHEVGTIKTCDGHKEFFR